MFLTELPGLVTGGSPRAMGTPCTLFCCLLPHTHSKTLGLHQLPTTTGPDSTVSQGPALGRYKSPVCWRPGNLGGPADSQGCPHIYNGITRPWGQWDLQPWLEEQASPLWFVSEAEEMGHIRNNSSG